MEQRGNVTEQTQQEQTSDPPTHPGVWITCKHCDNPRLAFVTDSMGFELLYGGAAVEMLVRCTCCGAKVRVKFYG